MSSGWSSPTITSPGIGQFPLDDTFFVEPFVLAAADIANKYVVLSKDPTAPTQTELNVKGGPSQVYGDDFVTVSVAGQWRLSWAGFALENILASGDRLQVAYPIAIPQPP